jgi:hypothetical protein
MIPEGTRFIGISPNVNLKERKSAQLNAETQPYTLDEIRGYKVYTALLTQGGGDDPNVISGGLLQIGVTYKITDDGGSGWDFTNVGAPNNNIGTYFIATGTTPNNWGNFARLEYNNGTPVVNVLENTIGNIWFIYDGTGTYSLKTSTNFIQEKVAPILGIQPTGRDGNVNFAIGDVNLSGISIEAWILHSGNFILENDLLANIYLEIRVYN